MCSVLEHTHTWGEMRKVEDATKGNRNRTGIALLLNSECNRREEHHTYFPLLYFYYVQIGPKDNGLP
jgi:hypothetical protein